MQPARLSRRLLPLLLITAFYLSACSSFISQISRRPTEPQISSGARALLLFLQKQNCKIKTFKGTGSLTFQNNDKSNLITRIAWIGAIPGRLRVAIYGVTGQPSVSFASDGQWYTFFSHTDNRFYKKRATAELFENYFSIPVEIKDLVSLLAGRVPVGKYYYAAAEHKGPEYETILILKNRWGIVFKKIYFNAENSAVNKMEAFDSSGALMYAVQLGAMQTVNGYQVPASLAFSKGEHVGFQLDVDRYWADVPVATSVFVLKQPKLDNTTE